jgi:hypothetical protein
MASKRPQRFHAVDGLCCTEVLSRDLDEGLYLKDSRTLPIAVTLAETDATIG